MVCRDCIVLAHQQGEGHELQELTEVKAEYVLTLEQLRLKIDNTLRERQDLLSCLRAELDTMDIVSMVSEPTDSQPTTCLPLPLSHTVNEWGNLYAVPGVTYRQ